MRNSAARRNTTLTRAFPLLAFLIGAAACDVLGEANPDRTGSSTDESPSVPGWRSLNAAREKLASGENDVALSGDGISWRYKRQKSGEEITGVQVSYGSIDVLTWTHAGPKSTGAADSEPNTIMDRRYAITRGAGSDGTLVITDDPEDDGTPSARATLTRVGDNVHVTLERPDATGQLKVVDEFDAAPKQALGTESRSETFDSSCRSDDAERLAPILEEGVTKGLQCLQRLGMTKELAILSEKIGSQGVTIKCESLPNNECAAIDVTDSLFRGAIGGPIGITVDTGTFFNNVFCQGNQASGIFHELMHVALGPHKPGFTVSNDRVFACQRLCFNDDPSSTPQVTQCQCATCLGTDECDERCKNFPQCGDNPPQCEPTVAIDDAQCTSASCSCDMMAGTRAISTMRGTISGPVGTKLQVNVFAPQGGTIMCGEWGPSACPITNVLKCCERTSEDQPQQTNWSVVQPLPNATDCICPTVQLPGVNWVAQAHINDRFVVEVERTGPPCN